MNDVMRQTFGNRGGTYEDGYADGIKTAMHLVSLKIRSLHDALNKIRDMDGLKQVRKEINRWDKLYGELTKELGVTVQTDNSDNEDDD